jgi:hypothetical protein
MGEPAGRRTVVRIVRSPRPATELGAAVVLEGLLDLGLVDAPWVAAVKDDMRRLEADPNALLITPMVLEIIAEKA